MDLSLTEEQVSLQDSIRGLLDDTFPTAAVRDCESVPAKAKTIYAELFALGIGGIALPESAGGLALGLTEVVVAHGELGAALVPMLFAETSVFASTVLDASGAPEATPFLTALAAGQATAACAWLAPAETPDAVVTLARKGSGFTISGARGFVPEADLCDYLVVDARSESGEAVLCIVERAAPGLTIAAQPNLADLLLCDVHFADTPVHCVIAQADAANRAWQAGLDAIKVAVAAQAVGGADRILGITRDYACTRQQFGQPIGAFQAIAHMLAEAAVNLEGARYLVYRAAAAADDGEAFGTWADMAKLKACQTFRDISALAIQVHGGIGFTLEADPQLFYRRAKHLQLMYGDPLDLQERTGEALLSVSHRVLSA